jgi:hypothetical protein
LFIERPAKAGRLFLDTLAVDVDSSGVTPPAVIPAKAGIQGLCSGALARAFRALRESLFFERQRKVTKRKPP